jgi:hypothetical protein
MRTGAWLTLSICLIGDPSSAQPAKPDQATIDYLHRLRNPDGGYAPAAGRPGTPIRSSLRATTAALRALKYLGGQPHGLEETKRFVEKCVDPATGGFGDFPGEPPTVATTAVGTMAAAEQGLPPDRYRNGAVKYLTEHTKSLEDIRITAAAFESLAMRPPTADDWLRQIAATRNPEGAFGTGPGEARATGGTAVMILRLRGTLDHRDAILKSMRAGQRGDGGFGSSERDGSDQESTYRVIRAFAMLKERPNEPDKLRAFIAKCRSADGGYGAMPGQPPTAAATYYAGIITHWLDAR